MPQATVYTRPDPERFLGAARKKKHSKAVRWIITAVPPSEHVSYLLPGRTVESANDTLQFIHEYLRGVVICATNLMNVHLFIVWHNSGSKATNLDSDILISGTKNRSVTFIPMSQTNLWTGFRWLKVG